MHSFKRILKEVYQALRGKPDLRDLYVAARDLGILRLNVKHYGYQLARQLEGKLQGVDCSHEPQKHNLVSKATTQEDMESAWFAYWCKQLKIAPIYHRKIWEYAFVLQCLHDHGLLHEAVSAMGFGCGEEPMASYFASLGIDVLVTDLKCRTRLQAKDGRRRSSTLKRVRLRFSCRFGGVAKFFLMHRSNTNLLI